MYFLIKNYIEIFHVVYKGNLSFQSMKSLDRSASVGEVDCLNIIPINLYVPMFTP